MALAVLAGVVFVWTRSLFALAAIPGILYLFPVGIYRLHEHFHPVSEGFSSLRDPSYSPWWGSHQIQVIYMAFPALEALLRLIPGAFSAWLRLWGAKVGEDVYWTPTLTISDRAFLQIGDGVVVGQAVGLYSHLIKVDGDNLKLFVKTIVIEDGAFIGAGSQFSPGVKIPAGVEVPMGTKLRPMKRFRPQ